MNGGILGFFKEYRFLSNFWLCKNVFLDGLEYPSVEHAYQAAKTFNITIRTKILNENRPGDVKRIGSKITLRLDWDEVKFKVMKELVFQKFNNNYGLKNLLLKTGDRYLEESNPWHDNTWGNCTCVRCSHIPGKNMLGKILMEVRSQLIKV